MNRSGSTVNATPTSPGLAALLCRGLDKLSIMLGYWDRNLHNQFSTESYSGLLGFTPHELLGQHLLEVLHNHSDRSVAEHVEAALQGERRDFEWSFQRPGSSAKIATFVPDVVDGIVLGFFAQLTEASATNAVETVLRESARKLQIVESQFRSILNDQADVISRLTGDGVYVYANQAFLRFFGKSEAELLGSRWQPIVYEEDLGRVTAELAALSPSNSLIIIENRVYSADKKIHWMEFSNRGIFDSAGHLVEIQSVGRDITKRKLAEEALQVSESRFRMLIDRAPIAIGISRNAIALYVNNKFLELFGFDQVDEVVGKPITNRWSPESRAHIEEFARNRSLGLPAPTQYEEQAVHKDGRVIPVQVDAAVIPLPDGPATIGFLSDTSEKRRAQARLQESLEQSIRAIADTVEARDPYTAGHQRRVADLAVAIAKAMGLSQQQIHGLRLAASIHDLGKINVPAEILAKPSRLSPIEYSLLKVHPEKGYDILHGIDFPWPVAEIVYQHHERIDGTGYPRGLKGDQIILEARILAVADVVEAMASHRPYRSGLGLDVALLEVERGRGVIYDPDVADACLKLFRQEKYSLQELTL